MNITEKESSMKTKKFIRNSTHLPVKDLQDTLVYYRDRLGFYEEWTEGNKDGGIRRDELRLLFAEDPDFVMDINNEKHRLPLLWFVDNIQEVLSEFKERNIEIVLKRLKIISKSIDFVNPLTFEKWTIKN